MGVRAYWLGVGITACLAAVPEGADGPSLAPVRGASGTTARLRGAHAVSPAVVWASGTGGTFVRSVDGGNTWAVGAVPGAGALDLRDVHALDGAAAFLLASGPGGASRVYQTTDAGATWALRFTNPDADGFLDAIALFDARRGLVFGDPVGRPEDGGASWRRVDPAGLPPARAGEGAFAASGTCLVVAGDRHAWFGTGGGPVARVFRSTDGGGTWAVADTPVRAGGPTAGIFSLAFRDADHGVAVGGDYKAPDAPGPRCARTDDGGRTWIAVEPGPRGYRSAVAYAPGASPPTLVAVGPTGADVSTDDGRTWRRLADDGYHAVSLAPGGVGYAVGDDGRVGRLSGLSRSRP